jgi:ElaA protein
MPDVLTMYQKTFEELTTKELYALLKLRQQVFVVEQKSIYQDLDDGDMEAIHYLDFDIQGELQAYARYRQVSELPEVKIERVVLSTENRGMGKGKSLIELLIADILNVLPKAKIKLSAQVDALAFYHKLGFIEKGQPYDDGGIPHITMFYHTIIPPK